MVILFSNWLIIIESIEVKIVVVIIITSFTLFDVQPRKSVIQAAHG